MFFYSNDIIGLDLHDHLIQFVELKGRGSKASLHSYNRTTLPEGIIQDGEIKNLEELKKILIKLFQESNPKPAESKRISFVMPSKVIFTHLFHFPVDLSEQELRKIIPIEVENIVPYLSDELYWDYKILEKEKKQKDGRQIVLFAATPKKVADAYTDLFSELGFTPVLFGIQPDALRFALSEKILDDRNNLVIELGAVSINFLFLKGRRILKFLSLNGGIETLMQKLAEQFGLLQADLWANWEKEKNDERFQPNIKDFIEKTYISSRTILDEYSVQEDGHKPLLIFTGEFSNLPHFYEKAEEFFRGYQVMIGDPKASLEIDDNRFLSNIEKLGGHIPYSIYFTDAIGVALRALKRDKSGVNLIPYTLKQHISEKKKTSLAVVTSLLITFLSGLIACVIFYEQQGFNYQRLTLEIEKSGIEKTLYGTRYQEIKEALTTFNSEVTALRKIDQTLISVPMVLETILDIVPSSITLTGIEYNDSDLTINLKGIARNRDDLMSLQNLLNESSYVKEASIPLSAYDVRDQSSFSVSILLNFTELPFYASSQSL